MRTEAVLTTTGPVVLGIPVVFLLFAATLALILAVHRRGLEVAVGGLVLIVFVRVAFSGLDLGAHLGHEWAKLANLLGLVVGFSLIADHFESSRLPEFLPRILLPGALGAFVLLALVWLLSGMLDNIAAAMIGAAAAARIYERRVHLGYLAAIVGCANAGGAPSVLGDTTTTMIWLDGVSPFAVFPAYLGAATALLIMGAFSSRQQARYAPKRAEASHHDRVDVPRIVIVGGALLALVVINVVASARLGERAERFPFLACALWLALGAGTLVRRPNWRLLPGALRSACFLVALVLAASLMPVAGLPAPSWPTALGLGFVSSMFDNIPLTKLALEQGGYDWALLAYSVGMGGSMIWFGSSAGVAVAGMFPEAKSVTLWLRNAWHVPAAFVCGYFVQLALRGWNP